MPRLVPVDYDPFENLTTATSQIGLSPEEVALYQMHLLNLTGAGGVDNPDGSRSTLYQAVEEHNGRFYSVPTVWNGKIETEKWTDPKTGKVWDIPNKTAYSNIEKMGWDKFPSYATAAEADARYGKMHEYMERDTQQYMKGRAPRKSLIPVEHNPFGDEVPQ